MRLAALIVLLLTFAGVGWITRPTGDGATGQAGAPRAVERGKHLYAEYCAACHGDRLQGQPDWQSPGPDGRLPPPPHDETGHTWHHPDSLLFSYTRLGGKAALAQQGIDFDSGMPGFGDQLSETEIRDILSYIKSTWPERQRNIQAERTRLDREQTE